jgi:hypothetical protein
MMPIYPSLAILSAVVVVMLELVFFRTGIFRSKSYWIALGIVFAFMIPVDGSGWRPVWDILLEEFAYAFALITLVLVCWERSDPERRRS